MRPTSGCLQPPMKSESERKTPSGRWFAVRARSMCYCDLAMPQLSRPDTRTHDWNSRERIARESRCIRGNLAQWAISRVTSRVSGRISRELAFQPAFPGGTASSRNRLTCTSVIRLYFVMMKSITICSMAHDEFLELCILLYYHLIILGATWYALRTVNKSEFEDYCTDYF